MKCEYCERPGAKAYFNRKRCCRACYKDFQKKNRLKRIEGWRRRTGIKARITNASNR
tara:strand:- start:537 stop:707 length:171 start_codon:yes stop_codon:yes gene_type:complete